jgi:hypothetical protein
MHMALIEKLGSFYLGKEYDLKKKQVIPDAPVNYDARDLTTHAVCVGMTGSGKTGLCIGLLEEAALDGVPALIIDPKGDLTNLLLTFPDLLPSDFLPWINLDDARRKGLAPQQYAEQTAETWGKGLADWDQGPERIAALKAAADFTIYTPGSDSGRPVSVLSSLNHAGMDWEEDGEALRENIQSTVSALLALAGIESDPIQSREHILLSTLVEQAWRAGEPVDMASLIRGVQKPPFKQVGVIELETFFPEKARFGLAVALNNIIASPSFNAWTQGEPLDIAAMLYTPDGKPRHAIFYLAHLDDPQRMFFVTLLLGQVIDWMRKQAGTTSLRALLYMDEVFGYFPPSLNPPSKRPLMTLLKQARAFGLGVMLTTQNPVDLDYKGLTNAGTWFIGKLQAERDKQRLLEGLESVAGGGQTSELDRIITSLSSRVFLMHNVHSAGPLVFQTRWVMSYLRGPLTKPQVKLLMAGQKADAGAAIPHAAAAVSRPAAAAATIAAGAPAVAAASLQSASPPPLPLGVDQVFLPVARTEKEALADLAGEKAARPRPINARLVYEPGLVGQGRVHFADRRYGLDEQSDQALFVPLGAGARAIAWRDATPLALALDDLEDEPQTAAVFPSELPAFDADARAMGRYRSDLVDHLYRTMSFDLHYSPKLKIYAQPGESEREFQARLQLAAREARDAAVDRLRDQYADRIERVEDRLARKTTELERDKADAQGRLGEEVIGGLATVAGALGLFGRRRRSTTMFSSAASRRRQTAAAQAEIQETEAEIAQLQTEIANLKDELERAAGDITTEWAAALKELDTIQVAPKRTDVDVNLVGLGWAPYWEFTYEDARGRQRTETVPAFPFGEDDA